MAGAVVDRTWREAAPDAIDAALAALRREIGARLPSARAVMSNLVVVVGCRSAEDFDDPQFPRGLPVDEVVALHPSRLILLAHEHGCRVSRAPIAARVGLETFGPPTARYSVEAIAVRSACADESVASIVRRLVRGDLPTSVWWADDLSTTPPSRSIVAGARQLIFDSRAWHDIPAGLRALQRLASDDPRLHLADMNWRRLAAVRRALLHVGSGLTLDALGPDQVHIAHRAGEAALAWLLCGWLGARVGWRPGVTARIEEGAADAPVLTLTVGGGTAHTVVTLRPDRLEVTPAAEPAYTEAVSPERDAEAIAAELRTLAPDADLRDVVAALTARQR